MAAKLEKISLLTILLLVLISTSTWASTTYQYDDLHRLTRVERADGSVTVYQYDDFGNRTSKVTAAGDTVTALFDATPSTGPAPLPVTFTDQSIGNITSWEWDFDGDDIVDSMLPSPSYTYTSPGTYTASLTVTGPAGSDTSTKIIQVEENITDTDSDGLPDWWEAKHYEGLTAADPAATAANGANTVLEAYIADINPTDPAAAFLISDFSPLTSVLSWNAASGRVYSVHWSSNLLSGFQPLESNIAWTAVPFTDTNHPAEKKGFYKIDVELE